jgi:phosphoglycerate dehydrogenase-like enzyme
MRPRIALAPEPVPAYATEAVLEAGAEIVPLAEAQALIWTAPSGPGELAATLARASDDLKWVHLRWAGVEDFASLGLFDPKFTWTCGKGVFAEPVAEHALALALAGLRDLPARVQATSWGEPSGRSLFGGKVTILGGGGITTALVDLLRPLKVELTVVRRSGKSLPWVHRVLPATRIDESLPGADVVVIALALTPETDGIIDAQRLRLMERHAWLVNVGRGRHVVTDDLVAALRARTIGGAALDVTHPEPLPDGHPLWEFDNCIITPHTANTFEMAVAPMKERIRENVRRFSAGKPLVGLVDPELGY